MTVTIFSDIAGRITKSTFEADRITASAVVFRTDALMRIVAQLPLDLPKWGRADNSSLASVIELLQQEALCTVAFSLVKGNDWAQNWDLSSSLAAANKVQGLKFLKHAFLIKCGIFGSITAIASAFAIARMQKTMPGRTFHPLSARLVFDKEIESEDNIQVFKNIFLKDSGKRSNFVTYQELLLATEQEERLLFLADYVAGLAHATKSSSDVLASSKVERSFALKSQLRLEAAGNYCYCSKPLHMSLLDIFPEFVFPVGD